MLGGVSYGFISLSLLGNIVTRNGDPPKKVVVVYNMHSKTEMLNSVTTEKQTTKFSSANFQKMLSPSYIIWRIQKLEGKQCRSR